MTLLATLVASSSRVASTNSRTAKIAEFAGLLKRLSPEELEIAIAFLSGEARQGKLAVGYAGLRGAWTPAAPHPTLTLADVDALFKELKVSTGKGSPQRKRELLQELLSRATEEEQDFLRRLVMGELRQGALEAIVLEAVAVAAAVPAATLRRAATFAGALAPVARAALAEGPDALSRFSVQLMQPVTPMLAQPASDVEDAMAALGTARLDWKVDGARVQVHKAAADVRVFTRNLNEVTDRVPEVVSATRRAAASSLILDGEVIALRTDGRPHPFQLTMRRVGRQEEDDALRTELPLSVFFFDCLLADERTLMDEPLEARRAALERAVAQENRMPSIVTADRAEARDFYERALAAGHEGIMAKALNSPYESGRRGANWLKIKREHTLDLVVLGAEWGHGRRRGRLSNLHLGARDPQAGGFVMLGKTFKGLTDEMLEWQTRELLARRTGESAGGVQVRPELVVEIAFNGIQQSSQYPGGMALRFARVKRYRTDKPATHADDIATVRQLFQAQHQ